MKEVLLLFMVFIFVPVFGNDCFVAGKSSKNYYFDPVEGSDSNSGTSPQKPFKTLSKIASLKVEPGDSILLKSGSVFSEALEITCIGDEGRPIVIGKYGTLGRPSIVMDGTKEAAIHVLNSEYLVIRDLEISNRSDKPIPGIHGLWIELCNFGTARDIHIDNLYVHDVTGSCSRENKDGGHAIFIQNYRDKSPDSILSCFDGMLIENCIIQNCSRSGIIFWGNWIRSKWKPSTRVVIRNNILDGVPGDGIVPVGCSGVLVEYNVMKNCPGILPVTEAADGIWPWSCDNAVIQYNIVSDHKSPVDAYGFDSDWNSNNSLFQYNLSFNNDGGFLLICNSGGWTPDWSIGNRGTIVRYNISINDGLRNYKLKEDYFSPVIHCTGPITHSIIEKNLFFLMKKPEQQIDKTLISFTDWNGYPDSTFFRNNFISSEEDYGTADLGKSTNTFFENNLFVGPMDIHDGFIRNAGHKMSIDENDKNWQKLFDFIRDKQVRIGEKTVNVMDIIENSVEFSDTKSLP